MKRDGYHKNGRYYVFCQDHFEEVSKDVYYAFMRQIWQEEKRQQRGWRCRDGKGRRCNGNCEECEIFRIGSGPTGSTVSLDEMYEENEFEPKGAGFSEDAVLLKIMLETLMDELNEMIPNAGRIVDMLKEGEMEKDVAAELGIAKTTLNYRKRKVIDFLRDRLADFI